MIEEVI